MTSDVRTYERAQSVVFFKTREAFGELSNMCSGYPLHVSGITIPSSEALYQACRFPHLPKVQEKVIAQKSPMTAKMVTKPYRGDTREDWDEIRVAVMKWCLRVKLLQHWKQFGDALLRTGGRAIVEQSSKDPFWGAIPDKTDLTLRGSNVLGRLLMELRELLKSAPAKLAIVQPVPVNAFCLLGKPIEAIGSSHNTTRDLFNLASTTTSEPRRRPAMAKRQLALFELSAPVHMPIVQPGRNYHVVASKRGGWDVLREGGKRVSAHFKTKSEAVERGRQLARSQRVDLLQHTRETSPRSSYIQESWLPA